MFDGSDIGKKKRIVLKTTIVKKAEGSLPHSKDQKPLAPQSRRATDKQLSFE
jgi:hypothetical protein